MTHQVKLFGTDGIRGTAGVDPILPEVAWLAGREFAAHMDSPGILVGMDTRESSPSLACAAVAGLLDGGAKPVFIGVVPTPILPFAIQSMGLDGGIMITASHNPWTDNGIKFFGPGGRKIPDNLEAQLDAALADRHHQTVPAIETIQPDAAARTDIADQYLAALDHHLPGGLPSQWLPLDCANGAGAPFPHELAKRHHLQLRLHNTRPDGRNINFQCGAAQPEHLRPGWAALDGDGDRILFRSTDGTVLNGDHLLMFLADTLNANGIVGTVMTNEAVSAFCSARRIPFHRTDVGDRHIRAKMDKTGIHLGGETSGHIIVDQLNPSGDGFAVYCMVLRMMENRGESLATIIDRYALFPQTLLNVPVNRRVPLDRIPGFSSLLAELEAEAPTHRGRIFPRYSGTENLLRILVESQSDEWNRKVCERIRTFFQAGGKA